MKEVTKKIVMTFMTVILVMGLMTAGTGILRVEAAKKVKLSVKKKTIDQDQSFTILVKNAKGKIKWSTSNDKIVSIKKINNKKYKVTGVSAGKAVVAVKVKNKTYKCNVTVRGLTTIKKTLDINEKTVIEAKNVGKNVKWSISNGKIATIKKLNGTKCEITGVSAGKTMVTAKVGKKKYTCAIVVSKKENTSSGVGIANVTISKEGNLVLTYTDGTVVTMDKVVGTIDVGMVKVELTAFLHHG